MSTQTTSLTGYIEELFAQDFPMVIVNFSTSINSIELAMPEDFEDEFNCNVEFAEVWRSEESGEVLFDWSMPGYGC